MDADLLVQMAQDPQIQDGNRAIEREFRRTEGDGLATDPAAGAGAPSRNPRSVDRRIAYHIANLNSPEHAVQVRAEGHLIRWYGLRAIDQLIGACEHPNPTVRLRAAWTLGCTQDPRAFAALVRMTQDPDERVRYDATIALGILDDERALEVLGRLLLSQHQYDSAAMALMRLGLRALPVLTGALPNAPAQIRWSMVQVLGNIAAETRDERCVGLLEDCAADPDPMVVENAEYWLDELGRAPTSTVR